MVQKPGFAFDPLDWRIVDLLKENGRITNRDIARQLGVTRAVVGSRIQRMTDAGALRIVAAADFAAYGYSVLLALAIRTSGRPAEAVADELAQHPEIFAVHLVSGAHQIEVLIALRDAGELSGQLMTTLSRTPGISRIDVCIATDILTYNFDVGISR